MEEVHAYPTASRGSQAIIVLSAHNAGGEAGISP